MLANDVIEAIVEATHGDPFAILGPHEIDGALVVRAFVPGAQSVEVLDRSGRRLASLGRRHAAGFFEGTVPGGERGLAYRLRVSTQGANWELEDPYRFGPVLGELDEHLVREGTHQQLYDRLGAHVIEHQGASGVHFALWAPNASRVAVLGDFNGWDQRVHPMRRRQATGVWEIFVPGLVEGALYKYAIRAADGSPLPLKADPLGFATQLRPETASLVCRTDRFTWQDRDWLKERRERAAISAPITIYEVHLGSWRREPGGRFLTYDELANQLIPYALDMGFTHLELLPINEHPFDGSWGYQPIGLFAPTSRFGPPAAFARFVDRAHATGLGVLLDWVPGHFPTDAHGLGRFDGTALYEHEDPRQGLHQEWTTLIYNYGRTEVVNFLCSNALFWLERYHLDGLRVDAVTSMLYLDYAREAGAWVPNQFGGNENLEAVAFLRRMNELAYSEAPGILTVAEESSSWLGVSRPTYAGGLGFGFKWNMGWMHDTLDYMGRPPEQRRHHHHQMTFGLAYAFSENFVLPLSHDEVVHGKGTLLDRMSGDTWQRFANLRAYYGLMWGHPGKKLLFMGQEFAEDTEWDHDRGLEWDLLNVEWHRGVQTLVRDLNRVYRALPALHEQDCVSAGFEWVEANDAERSVFAWLRHARSDAPPVLVIVNLTPAPQEAYRLGLPFAGAWHERINTDAIDYGGSGVGNQGLVQAEPTRSHGRSFSAEFTLPPLATVIFEHKAG